MSWEMRCTTVVVLISLFIGASSFLWKGDRLRLRDVQVLILRHGHYTTGRRSQPVPQLNCRGGSAGCRDAPSLVQCYNRGTDGKGVKWECEAEMKQSQKFGRVHVTCEGYSNPLDQYVLAGSCGLDYYLERTKHGRSPAETLNFHIADYYHAYSIDETVFILTMALVTILGIVVYAGVICAFIVCCDAALDTLNFHLSRERVPAHNGVHQAHSSQRPPSPGFALVQPTAPPPFNPVFTTHYNECPPCPGFVLVEPAAPPPFNPDFTEHCNRCQSRSGTGNHGREGCSCTRTGAALSRGARYPHRSTSLTWKREPSISSSESTWTSITSSSAEENNDVHISTGFGGTVRRPTSTSTSPPGPSSDVKKRNELHVSVGFAGTARRTPLATTASTSQPAPPSSDQKSNRVHTATGFAGTARRTPLATTASTSPPAPPSSDQRSNRAHTATGFAGTARR